MAGIRNKNMKVIKIISEHKKIKRNQPIEQGKKRVEAIVDINGIVQTRHIDISK